MAIILTPLIYFIEHRIEKYLGHETAHKLKQAAMGNENSSVPRYPAAFHQSINVGSIDFDGKRTNPFFWGVKSGSNFGEHIDVTAPGNYIYGITYKSVNDYTLLLFQYQNPVGKSVGVARSGGRKDLASGAAGGDHRHSG